ncbi:glycosyltransferase [Dactylosporangium sp. NPDC050688]|uniref:glycosyltransferase n=1 Tax=Dactylosporangium sp. NPDC050688 TaxID=3157217 RepID=UPI0033DBEE5C
MKILTGIDLPCDSPGGSVELLRDLYLGAPPLVPADVFMLPPATAADSTSSDTSGVRLLPAADKALSGPAFRSYVQKLEASIGAAFTMEDYHVVHLQHLTFGATPALLSALPHAATIALVHGTDLLVAAEDRTQAQVLRDTVAAADAVVVPALAMADRLRRLAPAAGRLVHIPWGVPDHLLTHRPRRAPRRPDVLRVLYAGRLSGEKITSRIIAATAGVAGVQLSVAAPPEQFTRLAETAGLVGVHHLGWLPRHLLWQEFTRYDLLIVPSLKLEAFGLVAIEAQACGLPVAYQPVPGLIEILGDSAVAVDFADPAALAAALQRLRRAPASLDELAEAGFANSAHYPLSRTAASLRQLSAELLAGRS